MLVSYSKGLVVPAARRRAGATVSTPGGTVPAPYWVRLERSGNLITGSQSADGVTWTVVDTAPCR